MNATEKIAAIADMDYRAVENWDANRLAAALESGQPVTGSAAAMLRRQAAELEAVGAGGLQPLAVPKNGYQMRCKDRNGQWSGWFPLGGGLMHSQIEVKIAPLPAKPADLPEALRLAERLEDMACTWSPSDNRDLVNSAVTDLRRLHAEIQGARGDVALLADILNRRPAMNAGLADTYGPWSAEVYDLMGAMAVAPANDATAALRARGAAPSGQEKKLDAADMMILIAGSKSGDPGAMSLAVQLAGVAPCPGCNYVKSHCRCAAPAAPPAAGEREYHAALQRVGTALGLTPGANILTDCVPAIKALRAAAPMSAQAPSARQITQTWQRAALLDAIDWAIDKDWPGGVTDRIARLRARDIARAASPAAPMSAQPGDAEHKHDVALMEAAPAAGAVAGPSGTSKCPGHSDGRHVEDWDGSCMGQGCDYRFRAAPTPAAQANPLRAALLKCIAAIERTAHCSEADRLAAADEARAVLAQEGGA